MRVCDKRDRTITCMCSLNFKVCRLPRSPVLSCKFTNTKMAAAVKNLTFTDEELPLHVLVGYKQKMKAKALIGRL